MLNNTLDPLALGVELEPVLVGLLNALVKLGEKDSAVQSDLNVLNEPLTKPAATV